MDSVRGPGFRAAAVIACVVAGLFLARASPAQAPADGPAAHAWDGGWKAGLGEEPARETVSSEAMVVAAYAALWVLLLLYVVRLSMELKALRRDTEELRRRLDEPGKS